MLFFVYGTLKTTGSHNHLLEGQAFLSPARTEPRYALLSCGNYPALVRNEAGQSIEGELWKIRREKIPDLDAYEGPEYRKTSIRLLPPHESLEVVTYLFIEPSSHLPDCGVSWDPAG